jgi:hypothetical protein
MGILQEGDHFNNFEKEGASRSENGQGLVWNEI